MKLVVVMCGVALIFNLIMTGLFLFARTRNGIQFSCWAKGFPVVALLLMVLIFVDTYPPDSLVAALISLAIFVYLIYAAFVFRFVYDGINLRWFNGLILRSIKADDIQSIVFVKGKRKATRIKIVLSNQTVTLRVDMPIITQIIESVAQRHGKKVSMTR